MVRQSLLLAALVPAMVSALYIPHDMADAMDIFKSNQPSELDDSAFKVAIPDEPQDVEIPSHHKRPHKGDHKGPHPGPHPGPHHGPRHGGHHKGDHHGEHHGDHHGRPHHRPHKGKHGKDEEPPKEESVDAFARVDGVAPLVLSPSAAPHVIKDKYIVVFNDDVNAALISEHMTWVGDLHELHVQDLGRDLEHFIDAGVSKIFDLGAQFRGYAGTFLPETIDELRRNPLVKFIEHDSKVVAFDEHEAVENGAPWGLARISHRKGLSLGTFNKYLYDDEGGEGVTAFVVDTGIYTDHKDFEGRAIWGKTIPANDVDKDAHGHGTHCAGTIAGKTYGVAKKAKVVAVKVLGSDGSGSMSDVIGGVEYTVAQHNKNKKDPKYKGTTANMSLGGGKSPSLDIAVNAAVNNGVHFAVAAGNENQDACNVSPAGASEPVTVGATTLNDQRAYFSNYGKCVDIFAPGVNVLSAGTSGPDSTEIMSGTSMASPHIAGLLTYFLSLQPSADSEYATKGAITPRQLKKNLISFGTPDILSDIDPASPNVLAYNGGGKDLSAFFASADAADLEEDEEETGCSKGKKHGPNFGAIFGDIERYLLGAGSELVEEVQAAAKHVSEDLRQLSEDVF